MTYARIETRRKARIRIKIRSERLYRTPTVVNLTRAMYLVFLRFETDGNDTVPLSRQRQLWNDPRSQTCISSVVICSSRVHKTLDKRRSCPFLCISAALWSGRAPRAQEVPSPALPLSEKAFICHESTKYIIICFNECDLRHCTRTCDDCTGITAFLAIMRTPGAPELLC